MELMPVVLGLINIVATGFLLSWVRSLRHTVDAQKTTIETLGGLNKSVLEMIKAVDPDRWAKEVQIHKDLADKKAEAIVESERRKLEEMLRTVPGVASEVTLSFVKPQLQLIFRMLPYVPRHARAGIINSIPELVFVAADLLKTADEFPDWSGSVVIQPGAATLTLRAGGTVETR